MMFRRIAPALSAFATLGLLSLPAIAQDGSHAAAAIHNQTAHPQGALRSMASPHVTPKRQHLMEQTGQHRMGGGAGGDAQDSDVERLNQMSLQRVQGTTQPGAAAPAQVQ